MTPFAIAGIQMPIGAHVENVTAMGRRVDVLMGRYPWVQMVVFSELAAFGPLIQFAQPLPGPAEASFQAMAARHGIWLLPGSLYEKRINQLDLRLTRTFALGARRVQGMVDVYNALNTSAITSLNTTYGSQWLRPNSIMPGRLVKFGIQMDW